MKQELFWPRSTCGKVPRDFQELSFKITLNLWKLING